MAFGRLIGNHVRIFQHNNTTSNNSPVAGYGHHATVHGLSELQLSSTTMKFLQHTVSTYNRNYLPILKYYYICSYHC